MTWKQRPVKAHSHGAISAAIWGAIFLAISRRRQITQCEQSAIWLRSHLRWTGDFSWPSQVFWTCSNFTAIWVRFLQKSDKNDALGVPPKEICQCFQDGRERCWKRWENELENLRGGNFDERMGKKQIFDDYKNNDQKKMVLEVISKVIKEETETTSILLFKLYLTSSHQHCNMKMTFSLPILR